MTKGTILGTPVLRVGSFEIDIAAGELRRAGRPIRLQPQPFRLLALLASRAGELVTREEIREQLWGESTFVDFEQGENHCIRLIRLALGDDARHPRFIETVPRRGYRFIAVRDASTSAVETPAPASASAAMMLAPAATVLEPALPAEPEARGRRAHRRAAIVAGLILVASAIGLVVQRPANACPRLAVMPFVCLSGDSGSGLAAGLTYEITTELVRTGKDGVDVVSGISTAAEAKAGRHIEADYLLEGSVQSFGDRVRVTVQITDARHLRPIWANSYERDDGDPLALRRTLAREIIAEVQGILRSRT